MNPPRVYTCSPSWTPLPPPSHTIPLGQPSAPAPSIQYHASNLDWRFVSYMILYMFQCHSPKSSHPLPLPQSPKTVLYICVSFAVSHTVGRGAWWAAVHGVAKSRTRMSDFPFTFHFHDWRRKWQPTPVLMPGKFHGWGSLVGYSPWSRKESDTTERLHSLHSTHIYGI